MITSTLRMVFAEPTRDDALQVLRALLGPADAFAQRRGRGSVRSVNRDREYRHSPGSSPGTSTNRAVRVRPQTQIDRGS